MEVDDYTISLKRNDVGEEPVTLINLKISKQNWPRVHQALEVLVTENPQFFYEAWYHGRKVVDNQRE